MYCKNCGKTLPDDARFCDKCNMSVSQEKGKMELIEELKEERLARKKAHEVEDRLKNIKKIRRKRYKIIMLIVLGFVIIWGAIVSVSFYNQWKDSALRPQEQRTPVTTATPEGRQLK